MTPLLLIRKLLKISSGFVLILSSLASYSQENIPVSIPPAESAGSTASVQILESPALQDERPPQLARPEDFTDTATFQGLNKITAHVSSLILTVGQTSYFGNLEITLHSCWKAPTDQEPESKAFIDILEHVPGEKNRQRFHGWMFASSPALSALEHPVYDITLINCTNSKDAPPTAIIPAPILQKPLEIDNLQDLD